MRQKIKRDPKMIKKMFLQFQFLRNTQFFSTQSYKYGKQRVCEK